VEKTGSVENLRQVLIATHREGRFLEAAYSISSADPDKLNDLAIELAALHNEGLIDIVAEFDNLKSRLSKEQNFFHARWIFEKTLPLLDAPIAPVVKCILQLYHDAGQDLAAGTVLDSYIDYCKKDASRPRGALGEIEANPQLADLLPATIAAGSQIDALYYLSEVMRLTKSSHLEVRGRAISSIAAIKWPEGIGVPDIALAALGQFAKTEVDDQILGYTVTSAFALFQHENGLESSVSEIIADALSKGYECTIYAASTIFGFHTGELSQPILSLILNCIQRVNPEHKGTLRNIDYGILHLLKVDREEAIQLLERLLLSHEGKLSLKEDFGNTAHAIYQDAALLSKFLTRWFVKGDRLLCKAIHEICLSHFGDDLPIQVDAAELKSIDLIHVVFLARKSVGYLFTKPISAASLIISLMRQSSDDHILHMLGELLFDPLLLNHPGKARDYVARVSMLESGKVKATIDRTLASIDEYLAALREIPDLPALHPIQAHKEAYLRYMSDIVANSYKEAQKKSVFMNLISKSTLLYGRKSIDYVYGRNGELHRTETPLESHGLEMEYPRMESIDPYGLDYILRVFRAEQFRNEADN
jgi:hypothetical protein